MAEAKTLLPEATVHFFVKDPKTAEISGSLENDWRFARVNIEVVDGTIDDAVKRYGSSNSPDLIIIETENIDDSFTSHLDGLANVCVAGTGAIFVGPVNDVALYRKLIDMGVTDYLVRPVDKEDLITVIAKGLTEKIGTSESRLVSVIGAKGGVGATTIAQLFSWTLATRLSEKTALMDCAGGWSVSPMTFHVDPVIPLREAAEVATKKKSEEMNDLLHQVKPNLSYLAVGGDPLLSTTINSDGFEPIVDRLMETYPTLVVDLSFSPIAVRSRALAKSHAIIVVSTPLLPSLRNARNLIQQLKETRDGEIPVHFVVNHEGMAPGVEVTKKDIIEAIEIEPAAIIPHDPKVFALSEAEEKAIYDLKGAENIINSIIPLASSITGKSIAPKEKTSQSFLGQLFGKK